MILDFTKKLKFLRRPFVRNVEDKDEMHGATLSLYILANAIPAANQSFLFMHLIPKLQYIAISVGGAINGTRKITRLITTFQNHFLPNLWNFYGKFRSCL